MTDGFREELAESRGRLWLCDIGGLLWASNSYWAVAVPDGTHPVATLLASFNLPLTPCSLQVGDTINPDPGAPLPTEKLAGYLTDRPVDLAPITQRCFKGAPLFIEDDHHPWRFLAVFDLPGGGVALLNKDYRKRVEDMAPGEWWGGSEAHKPLYRQSDGEVTGLLMPVRHHTIDGS